MPWQETLRMDQRVQFIADYPRAVFDVSELARRYAIRRKTAYKGIDRYAAGGPAATGGLVGLAGWAPGASSWIRVGGSGVSVATKAAIPAGVFACCHVAPIALAVSSVVALTSIPRYVTGRPSGGEDRARPALRHRIALAPEMQIEGRRVDHVLDALLLKVEAPRR